MTVQNAKIFIARVQTDRELVKRLNKAEDDAARLAVLEAEQLTFTYAQFMEAYSNLLANSQTIEQADGIKNIRLWWQMLQAMG